MNLVRIYQCFCDETRLRILNLLTKGPLCVCHFQSVLREPQVKISKHLNYLKRRSLVVSRQHQNWRIYHLPARPAYELEKHLKCLQDCVQENKLFRADLNRLKTVTAAASAIAAECCGPKTARTRGQKGACC